MGIILLKRYHLGFHKENGRIRCLAHIVNLVVQKILSSLGDADDPEKEDYFLLNKHLPIHYDADQDADVQEMEDEEYDNDEDDDIEAWELPDDIDDVLEDLVGDLPAVTKVSYLFLDLLQQILIMYSHH